MDSLQSSDDSSSTVGRRSNHIFRPRPHVLEIHIEDMEPVGARVDRITLERSILSGHGGGGSNLQPLVTRVAFRRVFTTGASDGILRPLPSSSSSSSSSGAPSSDDDDDATFDEVMQILFHQVPVLRHAYLMSELDARDEEYNRAEQVALLKFVEEVISKNNIAPAA